MDKALRDLVWSRCKGYCEFCGKQLPERWALHHRKLKSRGGKDEVENLVALHHHCHNTGTNAVHMRPAKATELGFMVSSWQEPSESPLTLPDGNLVILTSEGTYEYIKEQENGW